MYSAQASFLSQRVLWQRALAPCLQQLTRLMLLMYRRYHNEFVFHIFININMCDSSSAEEIYYFLSTYDKLYDTEYYITKLMQCSIYRILEHM